MATQQASAAAAAPPSRRALRWWAVTALVAWPGVTLAAGSILRDDFSAGWLALAYWLAIVGLLRHSARDHYHRGWQRGFTDGLFAGFEVRDGHVPAVVEDVFAGRREPPEPWEEAAVTRAGRP